MATDAIRAETVWLDGAVDPSADRGLEAYLAHPRRATGRRRYRRHPPHARLRRGDARRSRGPSRPAGYAAICPNLYSREAPRRRRADDASRCAMAQSGVPDERLIGDVALAAARLPARRCRQSNGKVGVDRVLLRRAPGACSPPARSTLDAAVDCYGAFVVERAARETTLLDRADRRPHRRPALSAARPVRRRGPQPVARGGRRRTEELLRAAGKTYEFHTYDDAGHAFFATNRPTLPGRGGQRRRGRSSGISCGDTLG